ncbi:MAG: pantoate--beta-alanine ligase [Candidatus Lightella neohaematopini]|nr:pantoate--beta-alanine ligase [Candidatus Lightella neohaematopini]MCV2531174.1 pantoate--beta-alanine ligase [Candidatus Lightella neohaematopini]
MKIIRSINNLKKTIKSFKDDRYTISLVPTMGNIHNGHISLVKKAKSMNTICVVSIFVNPTQFNQSYDLDNYPRSIKSDCKKLMFYNVDIVFIPSILTMYPSGINNYTCTYIPILSEILEGKKRMDHYKGVATIVSKLFNLIQPNLAFFGEKDFQQLMIIKRMVYDMHYDIKIISIPIIREANGLAYSSRNTLLNDYEYKIAHKFYLALRNMADELKHNIYNIANLIKNTIYQLKIIGFVVDSLYVLDYENLTYVNSNSKHIIILSAVWLGKVRLIDNIKIKIIK